MNSRTILSVPTLKKETMKVPHNIDYPNLTEDLLTWTLGAKSNNLPSIILNNSNQFICYRNYAGRIGLLNKTSQGEIVPSKILLQIKEYLRKNPQKFPSLLLNLFLSEIPQFLIINLFLSLQRAELIVHNNDYIFQLQSNNKILSIKPSLIINNGLELLNIRKHQNHTIDYIRYLIHWSERLGLVRHNDSNVEPSGNLTAILRETQKQLFNQNGLNTINRLEQLKRDLLRMVVILKNTNI